MQCYYRDRIDIIISILDIANDNEVRQAEIIIKQIFLTLYLENTYITCTNFA
jgi:hypothetical protein